MANLPAIAERLASFQAFLDYRKSVKYANEELPLGEFGFGAYDEKEFIYPEQSDRFWREYPYSLVKLQEYRVITTRLEVYSNTVEHYLMTPLLGSGKGSTRMDGIAPHALVSEDSKTIYLAEGNHRSAAAVIAHRPLLMKLAPLAQLKRVHS